MREELKKRIQATKSQLILEIVSKYFDRVGYEKPTMKDIASEIGISVGALYKLFPSKDELFFNYIKYQIESFYRELIQKANTIKSPKERLLLYIEMKFRVFQSKKRAIEDPLLGDPLFFLKMNTRKDNPAQPIFEFLASEFEALNKELPLKSDNYLKLAYIFNSHTLGYIEYWINCKTELKEDSKEVLELFLEGIKS